MVRSGGVRKAPVRYVSAGMECQNQKQEVTHEKY
nr:MAG TPA: hypothetical protein [Caudoviricetes sp.]